MDENNVNNQEGNVYVVGTRGYSAYEVAVLNGFEGTVDEWLASLQGEQGPEGPEGPQGNPGPTGLTPSIRVGSVTTGEPNTNVIITITGTPEVPIINFTIPKGAKGDPGESASSDYSDLENKPQIGGITLQGNLSLVDLGIQPAGSYITNTDYAEWNAGGIIKTGNGFNLGSTGAAQCSAVGYSSYQTQGNSYFISKGTLEAVFTGKGFLTEHQDLTDYVKKTDYATTTVGGVIIPARGMTLDSNGKTQATVISYSTYPTVTDATFISKGTLENVIAGKELVNKTYVDSIVGDINTALDSINCEVI